MKNRATNESGVALVVVLLLMLVFTIMILGFYFETTGEQRVAASDRDNSATFYAAQGALENMSSNLASLFASTPSPVPSQITALTASTYQQSVPIYNSLGTLTSQAVTYSVYTIANLATPATTNPTTAACTPNTSTLCSTPGIIPGNGPLAGLEGILTPFLLTVIADGPNNTEVKMTRQVQEVAVPVFQYGIFSQSDLSFFAGPDYGFGGRTATNGNLFLAENGGTLTLNDKVTAFGSIIRAQLSNGLATGAAAYGTSVDVTIGPPTGAGAGGCPTPECPTCPTTTCRALGLAEGSVTGGPGSAANPNWQTLSMTTYGGYIRSGSTGVKQLNLALALAGASPIATIERPPSTESATSQIGQQRFFNQASVRILLSDTQAQITGLPGVTSSAPYPLTEQVTATGYTSGMGTSASNYIQRTTSTGTNYLPPTDSCHPPIAQSPGWTADNDYMLKPYTTLLGGYIKIEIQLNSSPGTWQDVTKEVLSLGISRDIQSSGTMSPAGCTNISILHLEEARPFPPEGAPTLAAGSTGGSLTNGTKYYYIVTPITAAGAVPGTEASFTATSSKKINLTWSAYTAATVTGYYVYRGTSAGGETGYINVGNVTSYTDTGGTALTAGTPPTTILNTLTAATTPTNFVPINIYDPREGELRDSNNYTTVSLNGVMNLLDVDVGNLQMWLANTLCTASTTPTSCPSGALALNNSGYILYVSDRRGNCNQTAAGACAGAAGSDTGAYGYEDIVNPLSGTGAPNNTLDTGEDVDGDGVLDLYGGIARPINAANVDSSGSTNYPTGSTTTLTTFMASLTSPGTPNAAPLTRITSAATGVGYYEAQKNPVLFFRRAVRLVDGTLGNLPPLAAATLATCPNAASPATYPSGGGFSVATENPLYIQGDYNASNSVGAFSPDPSGDCHVPAAVYADAVTLLSNDWVDGETFANPTNEGSRPATTHNTWYRVAIIGGKNISFPLPTFTNPAAPPQDFGTDGGSHNFLRYIENWNSTLNYLGAMVSFYYAQQGTGIYKCCSTVYNPPTRAYAYDTDFTNITSLPPGTPRFTDVNALSYQQAVLATQ